MKSFQVMSFIFACLLTQPGFAAKEFQPIRLSRSQWGAMQARSNELTYDHQRKTHFLVAHQGATARDFGANADAAIARSIQEYHMGTQRWADIGYHMMIGRNGTVLDGRDINAEPVCHRERNSGAICMAFLGCFDRSCNPPNQVTNNMIYAMGRVIGEIAYQLRIPYLSRNNIVGISEIGDRYPTSPGSLIMYPNATGHVQIDVITAIAQRKLAALNGRDDL